MSFKNTYDAGVKKTFLQHNLISNNVIFFWDFPYTIIYLNSATPLGLFSNRISNPVSKTQAYYAGNRQKVEYIRPKAIFSHYFGRLPPLTSIPSARFSAVPQIIPAPLVLSQNTTA
jgi:hypothetical protein